MRILKYIQEPRRLSLMWRAGLANGVVFVVVFVLILFTPVTVSAPIRLTEAIIIGVGLAAMFAVNVLLVRRALAPLTELADRMGQVDLRDPNRRIGELGAYGPILTEFVETFNTMLDRLAEERLAGARAALAAQERERLRIGRALHDEAGQTLTAVALEIERIAANGPEGQRERMAALAGQLHESLDDIRRISRDLRPEALDDLGLLNALIALTSRIDRQGLRVERRFSPRLPSTSSELELVIYRVAQEALTNVLRHAEASECVVSLEASNGQIELRVSDDGIGMPRELPQDTIGIEGMRERALLANGTLSVESRRRKGTDVILRVPARREG